jgi:hypothetical protein
MEIAALDNLVAAHLALGDIPAACGWFAAADVIRTLGADATTGLEIVDL